MDAETIIQVMRKLIGPIEPIGSAHVDKERLTNLKTAISVVEILLYDIDGVTSNVGSHMASADLAGTEALKFFDQLRAST